MELTIAMGLVCCALGAGLPVLQQGADARRARDAASFLAGQFRLARQRAVLTGRHVAIVFEDVAGEVAWKLCSDGDRDGVSRSDLVDGTDRCDSNSEPVSARFSGVSVAVVPGIPSPDGDTDWTPVRFGASRMAVFTPHGTASSGTVAIAGPSRVQYAVRVSGATGRTRVVRFDSGRREWVE